MRKSRKVLIEQEKKNYDARSTKRNANIDWFANDSSWCPPLHTLPEEYAAYLNSFKNVVDSVINSVDISRENRDCLKPVVDAELHVALRQMDVKSSQHRHSLMEIETTKRSHMFFNDESISFILKENEELERMTEEE